MKTTTHKPTRAAWRFLQCLVLATLISSCGKNNSPINPTERVEGVITVTQETNFTQPRHCIIQAEDGTVKRVYGIWGKVGDKVIIEEAQTF